MELTIKNLELCFQNAVELGFKYVAVRVRMEGFNSDEVIINQLDNAVAKLEYYKSAYNYDLTHKHAGSKIQIVGFTFGDTFEEIEEDFFVYDTVFKEAESIDE